MDDSLDAVIDRDQRENPGCQYSQQSSRSYRMVNGEGTSELLQRVVRHCRGEKPVEIFNNRVSESGGERIPATGIEMSGPNDLESFVKEFARPLEGLLGGFLASGGAVPRMHERAAPDLFGRSDGGLPRHPVKGDVEEV